MSVIWTRPFYDGSGKPLIGATVTLRNAAGTVLYTCAELTDTGYAGCYSVSVEVTALYYIWVQQKGSSNAFCLTDNSPVLIASDDIPAI